MSPAYLLGASMASCLLWWPLAFLGLKTSLKLQYKWKWFLVGYMASVAANAIVLGLIPQDTGEVSYSGIIRPLAPLLGCIAIGFCIAPKLRQTQKAKV